jgi:hypothetical protein
LEHEWRVGGRRAGSEIVDARVDPSGRAVASGELERRRIAVALE